MAMTLAVIHQATRWKEYAHFSSIVIPADAGPNPDCDVKTYPLGHNWPLIEKAAALGLGVYEVVPRGSAMAEMRAACTPENENGRPAGSTSRRGRPCPPRARRRPYEDWTPLVYEPAKSFNADWARLVRRLVIEDHPDVYNPDGTLRDDYHDPYSWRGTKPK